MPYSVSDPDLSLVGCRFCNIEARLEGMGSTVINTAASIQSNSATTSSSSANNVSKTSTVAKNQEAFDHPLAMAGDESSPDGRDIESPTPPILTSPSSNLKPVNAKNICLHLSSNDVDRIKILVRE